MCALLSAVNPGYTVNACYIIWVKIARILWEFVPRSGDSK